MNVWEANLFMVNYITKVGKNKRKNARTTHKTPKYTERTSDRAYVK